MARNWVAGSMFITAAVVAGAFSASVALAAGHCTVVGAGTTDFNGAYTQVGTLNEKPYFSGGHSESAGADRAILYGKGRWTIGYMSGGVLQEVAYGAGGGDCPPADGWETYSGLDPAPSLTDIVCESEDEEEADDTFLQELVCHVDTPLALDVRAPVLRPVYLAHWNLCRLEIISGPSHGLLVIDPSELRLERAGEGSTWIAPLFYVPAGGYTGHDAFTAEFVDVFHLATIPVETALSVGLAPMGAALDATFGHTLLLVAPLDFKRRQDPVSLSILAADGTTFPGAVRNGCDGTRCILELDTAALSRGAYIVSAALWSGEVVTFRLILR